MFDICGILLGFFPVNCVQQELAVVALDLSLARKVTQDAFTFHPTVSELLVHAFDGKEVKRTLEPPMALGRKLQIETQETRGAWAQRVPFLCGGGPLFYSGHPLP